MEERRPRSWWGMCPIGWSCSVLPGTGPQMISAGETLENDVDLEDDRYVHVPTVHNFIKILTS